MALKRPDFLEKYLKQGDDDGNVQQMTVVPGLLGGARKITYTGKGADGRVQTDNPVMTDMTAYHEDEIVVPSTSVARMGGPERARMKIQQLEMKKAQKKGGMKGFEEGSLLTDKQRIMAAQTAIPSTTTSGLTDKQTIMAAQTPTPTPAPATDLAAGVYAAKAGIQAGTDTQKDLTMAAKAATVPTTTAAPVVAPPKPDLAAGVYAAKAAIQAGTGTQADLTQASQATTLPTTSKAAVIAAKNASEVGPAQGAGALTAEQIYARNALTTQKGAPLTTAELQTIVNSTSTQLEQQLTAAGLKPRVQQEAADAQVAGQYSQYANEALNQMRAFANGTSDVYQRQANAAFLALDARLQTQLMSTAMRIASQPGLTDGARRTMMAEQMRNAGLAQSSLAGTLADQVMKTAMAATGQAYTMATGERDFQTQQMRDGMAAALAGEDWDTYAALSKKLYGVSPDMTSVKSTAALQKIADGNEFIYTAITNDPNTSMATSGVRTALQSVWDAEHPGQPMDETWATTTLATMKRNSSQAYQYMQGIDDDAATGLFGGDTARMSAFQFGSYKPGLESVQHAMYGFMTGGAFTIGADGFMDFNENNPIYQEMLKTFGWTGTTDGVGGTTGKTVVSTLTNTAGVKTVTYSDGSKDVTDASGNVTNIPAPPPAAGLNQKQIKTGINTYTAPGGTVLPSTTKDLSTLNSAATTAAGIAGQSRTNIATPTPIGQTGMGRNAEGLIYDLVGGTPVQKLSDNGNPLKYVSATEVVDTVDGTRYNLSANGDIEPMTYEQYTDPVATVGDEKIWKHDDGTYSYEDPESPGSYVPYNFSAYKRDLGTAAPDNTIVSDMLAAYDPAALSYVKTNLSKYGSTTDGMAFLENIRTTQPDIYSEITADIGVYGSVGSAAVREAAVGTMYKLADGQIVRKVGTIQAYDSGTPTIGKSTKSAEGWILSMPDGTLQIKTEGSPSGRSFTQSGTQYVSAGGDSWWTATGASDSDLALLPTFKPTPYLPAQPVPVPKGGHVTLTDGRELMRLNDGSYVILGTPAS